MTTRALRKAQNLKDLSTMNRGHLGELAHAHFERDFISRIGYKPGSTIPGFEFTPDAWTPEGYPVELKPHRERSRHHTPFRDPYFSRENQIFKYLNATGAPLAELWTWRLNHDSSGFDFSFEEELTREVIMDRKAVYVSNILDMSGVGLTTVQSVFRTLLYT